MKLYTEEQVRKIYCIAYLGGHSKYIMDFEEDVKLISPIKLPSDEEIGKEMDKLPFSKHVDDGLFNDGQLMGFELGAEWMKEQILNQNKTRVFGESDDKQFWSDKPNQNK